MLEIYDRQSSEFYDYHNQREDVKFFVDFGLKSAGEVLEIGCGTGRILIPSARAGVKITGLDKSGEMLKICKDKLAAETAGLRSKTNLVQADMRNFELGKKFSLITITYGAINYLVSIEEQLASLGCIRKHLTKGGTLLFDVYYPDNKELSAPDGTDVAQRPFVMPDGRNVVFGVRYAHVDSKLGKETSLYFVITRLPIPSHPIGIAVVISLSSTIALFQSSLCLFARLLRLESRWEKTDSGRLVMAIGGKGRDI